MPSMHAVTRRCAWSWLLTCLSLAGLLVGCGEPPSAPCARTVHAFLDTDGDGVGTGTARELCAEPALPAGYVEQGGDCDPRDGTRWAQVSGLFRDEDGDGATAGAAQVGCIGSVPEESGWRLQRGPEDCDDRDASKAATRTLYEDADADGAGAGEGREFCLGSAPAPQGWTEQASDCAPSDRNAWRMLPYAFRDEDGDGVTVDLAGEVCAGAALPAGYSDTAFGDDCDDQSAARWAFQDWYLDEDGDDVGSGPAVALCSGLGPPSGYAVFGEDCAPSDGTRWGPKPYTFRDADGDGARVPQPGEVCSGSMLPAGYALTEGTLDCDDTRPDAWVSWQVYPDGDGDGVGAGTQQEVCAGTSVPQGFSREATDCAAEDSGRWQVLSYAAHDADGDGKLAAATGTLCSGATLPAGYAAIVPAVPDCDDANAAVWQALVTYADSDADGVGAGEALTQCTDGSVPAGYSGQGSDCAPGDALAWQVLTYNHVDEDGDGSTTPRSGTQCSGATLLPPFFAKAQGNDCDDADAAHWRWVLLYPDADADGVGSLARQALCLGETLPPGLVLRGGDVDDADPARQEDEDEEALVDLLLSE